MAVKTKYEEIVDVGSIGADVNPIQKTEIYEKAGKEKLPAAVEDKESVFLLAIDEQRDFMEGGSLPVPGSHADILRATKWIYKNMEKITRIVCSLDTHQPWMIFFSSWWIDKDGKNPPPYTMISKADVDSGKWIPVQAPKESIEYVAALEAGGKKTLMIWPPHCIQGTTGYSLENQFANMVYFHSIARRSIVKDVVKGYFPTTEMYGIFRPEYDPQNKIEVNILNMIQKADKIVVIGQAKSHCVLESIKQMLDFYNNTEVTKKIFILTDCMSSIPGFEKSTEDAYAEFKNKFKVNLVTTQDFNL